MPGPDPSLLARLRAALGEGPPLRLAVLFGSHATGAANKGSDVDVGIFPAYDLSLGDELAEAHRLSTRLDADVDLVRIDQDEPLLGLEVAKHGHCLYEAEPGIFSAYRATAVSRWLDFDETIAPHRKRFLDRLRKGA